MGFNVDPFTCRNFSIVNTTVIHGLLLVESVDVELWIHKYKGTENTQGLGLKERSQQEVETWK